MEATLLQMDGNYFYLVLIGELYSSIDKQEAKASFEKALALAKTPAEKQHIQQKLEKL